MEVKEWLEHPVTRQLINRIEAERLFTLESILLTDNKDEACGKVKGITEIMNLIIGLEEGDLGGS